MVFEPDYYPKFWEGMILLLTSLELVAAGSIIKRHWTSNNEPLPIVHALVLWFVMVALYFTVAAAFYQTTAPDRKITLLGYCILFWVLPAFYFTRTLLYAVEMQTVDRIGPFSARIDDPSEFAAARKLALRGDIDGAVARYREYQENQAVALFEAARLLKSEDRFKDAASLYEEVAERYYGRRRVWAEATHNLAKLLEVTLNERVQAAELYRQILTRAPETRFGQLAGADLARLQVLDGEVAASRAGDDAASASVSPDPFYRRRESQAPAGPVSETAPAAAPAAGPVPSPPAAAQEHSEVLPEDVDVVIPAEDPFLRLRRSLKTTPEPVDNGSSAEPESTPKARKPRKPRAATKPKTSADTPPALKRGAKPKRNS